jgi:hypothetical protein
MNGFTSTKLTMAGARLVTRFKDPQKESLFFFFCWRMMNHTPPPPLSGLIASYIRIDGCHEPRGILLTAKNYSSCVILSHTYFITCHMSQLLRSQIFQSRLEFSPSRTHSYTWHMMHLNVTHGQSPGIGTGDGEDIQKEEFD